MTEFTKSILDEKAGYIVCPRGLVGEILENGEMDSPTKLYFYLLFHANYTATHSRYGELKRGETNIPLTQIAERTHTDYRRLRRLIKQLADEGLVEYIQFGFHRRIILPYYEQHCGRKVRKEEKADGRVTLRNKTDRAFDLFWEFYHEMLPTVSQTDREKARKIYGRLTLKERDMAIQNVEAYYNSLDSEKHAKWAVNYLKDKSFILPQK